MSPHVFKGVPIRNGAPPWMKERRQPTREELAAKHAADGGGMALPPGANTLPDDVPEGPITLSDGTTLAVAPAAPMEIKRYNK